MELKTKYQYSYFIHPYIIEQKKYQKYILKLLKDKNCKLKIFEKEKDLNMYTYFLPNIRREILWSFEHTKEQIKTLDKMNSEMKSALLEKKTCNIFEYSLSQNMQGKIGEENGLFFEIQKIELICFNTGICFLLLKTIVEQDGNLSDVLNFNYKFREITADYSMLKDYENIRLQTNSLKSMKDLSTLINTITGNNEQAIKMNLDVEKFLTYSYTCIEQNYWNKEEEFENIKEQFIKYTNILPNSYQVNVTEEANKKSTLSLKKFTKVGVNKQATVLLTSSANVENYTKLPYSYEREYLYTYIFTLYKKIYLSKINIELRNKNKFAKVREDFINFTSLFWIQEITNNIEGSKLYEKWKEVLELDYIYSEIKNRYDITYKHLNIERINKVNLITIVVLVATLTFSIINFIYWKRMF